ncbi:uncharacterized protein RSE6_01972 [Rhynchosporium secalis]|uniref:Uncharacterized protein n=1 Tax=Rhynchosporium secalis TaxID=38038 RepID=A0A1E1M0Q8_RHYSE|nr:uncharacterized protein RSE6_01972 [Rhynchosporium secalis]
MVSSAGYSKSELPVESAGADCTIIDISQGGYRDMQQMQETGGLFLYKENLNSFITGSKARRKLNTQSMSTVSLSLKTTSKLQYLCDVKQKVSGS